MNTHSKTTLAAAAALLAAAGTLPGAAHAQSNVTLYGRVVAGVEYINKIADPVTGQTNSLTRAADNQWGTSMIGFRGKEDLGGGLSAVFNLEGGFSATKGTTGSAFFNRRSLVGLSSASWGTLMFGKNLFNSNDVWNIDPTGQQFMSSATLVRGRNWPGVNNLIEYTTPNFGGFTANVQLGMGEQPGSNKQLRNEGLSLAYAANNLEVRAMLNSRRDANGNYSDAYNYSKDAILGGTYRIGAAKLFAAYEAISAPDAAAGAPSKLKHGWLGVRYDVTSALTLIGAGYRVSANRGNGNATLLMVGADYYLSKRTFLYASLGGVNNSSTANYAADVTVNGPGAGASQRAMYFGMGHSF
ncbi:porin [Acidovorax sp. NCPPB 3859]|nr:MULTISPECIES: porin [unclassified Acidovorax]MDA8449311.1 porin [Acidovorax sp. GBBC 3297]MDA8458600.1 porin [Acidovorax sp. GBBC 3333]MDA8463638.1 porin [Acidovorax sp. GBBC 3332]MDA8468491.1 porin [Acidovorax sp. GBBC 3299]WCM76853.1 porin [Acidovorax sp. GBBC 712]